MYDNNDWGIENIGEPSAREQWRGMSHAERLDNDSDFQRFIREDDSLDVLVGFCGTLATAALGLWAGEAINNNVEYLKQAPALIQYGVDAAAAIVSAGIFLIPCAIISGKRQRDRFYNKYRRFPGSF